MQTLVDASQPGATWLVKLVAGLPGGIGNTGGECGGLTAPLAFLGLRHAREPICDGLPAIVYKGHDLIQRFNACNSTVLCRRIRGGDRLPLRCVGVIRRAPEQYLETLSRDCTGSIPESCQRAYRCLYAHFMKTGFHCAHHLFHQLDRTIPVTEELLDATSGFIGGTVFTGMTCSAFTAGVMAMGVALAQIENSRMRVLRMLGTMAVGGNAIADDLNAFNRTVNRGHRLSEWFIAEFGSTQCRAITQCDFGTSSGVERYIDTDGTSRCCAIAERVAMKVESWIKCSPAGSEHSSSAVRDGSS